MAPRVDLTNVYQEFLAHSDAPEVWDGDVLLSGGKHYGHLEIDVILAESGLWNVTITPAYAFPVLSPTNPGEILGWERRTYDYTVTFVAVPEPSTMLLLTAGVGGMWCVWLRRSHRVSTAVAHSQADSAVTTARAQMAVVKTGRCARSSVG